MHSKDRNRGGPSRMLATDPELMEALVKAKAKIPPGVPLTIVRLAQGGTKFLPVSVKYFRTFLSQRASDDQRKDLGLPVAVRDR